jgi:tetratricopeptide (TPR) repeat protein
MTLDLTELWDFSHPARSEERLRAALATVSGDDALILQTQIARTFGLRGDFAHARQILAEIAPSVEQAGGEARVRHALEWGRTLSSAVHTAESQTEPVREAARAAFGRALTIAQAEALDGLAIDALHMLAFVDSAPAEQLRWGLQALAVMEASSQPAAQQWEGSLRNNVGYALHQLGRYGEALAQFELALAWRERTGSAESIRVARWMVAWTLRFLGRSDEALALQLQLEQACEAAGAPDPYVFEELEHLYRARNDMPRAAAYAVRRLANS